LLFSEILPKPPPTLEADASPKPPHYYGGRLETLLENSLIPLVAGMLHWKAAIQQFPYSLLQRPVTKAFVLTYSKVVIL